MYEIQWRDCNENNVQKLFAVTIIQQKCLHTYCCIPWCSRSATKEGGEGGGGILDDRPTSHTEQFYSRYV